VASYNSEQVALSRSSTESAVIMPRMIEGLNKDLDQDLKDWGFALEIAAETCRCEAVDLLATAGAHLCALDDLSMYSDTCHFLKCAPINLEARYA
jgi:hypothetical protein